MTGDPAEEFGPYVVYERLGQGGMASVHRAVTHGIAGFSREVALKRMLPSVASNAELVKSFVREARLASYLRHANVAQTYELGKVGDIYFIAMELVAGKNLREILKHCVMVCGAMPVAIALNIINQLCDALDYAHNLRDESGEPLGIIHRDVSPANLIISEAGVLKLIDFGIAKASSADLRTMSGTVKGKFSYMAPEYLVTGKCDARADLFAVGVIAHELLSNRPLFQGKDDMDTLIRVRDMTIDPPSKRNRDVAPELDDIILTALAREPDRRWQHATALRNAMTTITKRLGLVATDADVVAWVDRAFARTHDDDSGPNVSIEMGTVPAVLPVGSNQVSAQGSYPAHAVTPLQRPSAPHLVQRVQGGSMRRSSSQTAQRSSASQPAVTPPPEVRGPRSEVHPAKRSRALLYVFVLLLLLAAAAAGAYFAVPEVRELFE